MLPTCCLEDQSGLDFLRGDQRVWPLTGTILDDVAPAHFEL